MKKRAFVVLNLCVVAALLSGGFVSARDTTPPELVDGTIVRVYYPDDATRIQVFLAFEPWLLETNYEENYHVMQVTREQIDRLAKLGLRVERDDTREAPAVLSSLPVGIESIPSYPCYRTVEETFASAQALATAHPDLATWIDVGDSWEKATPGGAAGYDMMVLKLTNSAIVAEKPKLFVTGSIHAREYTPAELVTRFGEYLVNNYGVDADATWILDHHEVHLLLQANPDGRKWAEQGYSWRKNTNNNYCSNTTSRGADLNRNFAFKWACCGGSSGYECDATYRGSSAASEPETQAIQDYMASIFEDQRGPADDDPAPDDTTGIYLDIHSYSELVLWPWGTTSTPAPNADQLQTLGRKFAYFNNYTPQQAYSLYPTDGTTDGHAYGTFGVASYCFELGTRFFQACSTFENTILPDNLQALVYAAKVVRTPYMTPLGPDALSLALSADQVPGGTSVTLDATIDDARYRSGTGEPSQDIAAAEYYVDTPPWDGGTGQPMGASDGSFDETIEGVTATIDTTALSTGRHILFVRGRDADGNWGAFSAVFLTISGPPSEPPTANPQSVTTDEDRAVSITLTGSDPEDDPLTFAVQSGPTNGTLTGTAPDLTYTPAADYYGSDSFTFVANDGQSDSDPATVSITVTPVNDAPVANPQSVVTQLNTPVAITLTGSDVDGDPLTFSLESDPSHGTLSGTGPNLTYTPDGGYTGDDSFSFTVDDGTETSAPAAVSITVSPPGPVTVFFDDFESDQGWITDPDGSDTATTGVWERANPEETSYNGTKQLGTTVSGSYDLVTGHLAGSSVGSYDIDGGVTSIRSPEIALPSGGDLELSFSFYLAHLNNSSSDDFLRVTVEGSTSQVVFEELGAADDDDAAWEAFSGSLDDFAGETVTLLIEAADAGDPSLVEAAVDDVLILATSVNQPPTANPQTVETDEDTPVDITLTGSDPEGSPLTFEVTGGPSYGTLSGTAPDLIYTPDADYNGDDGFTFVASDGTATSAPATVSITVNPVNDAPVADPQSISTLEDTPVDITLTGSDVDGDELSFAATGGPNHGTLSGTAPDLTYTPNVGYVGADSFQFVTNDGMVNSAPATISITVTEFNEPPVAYDQDVTTDEDVPVAVTLTGYDPDGDPLSYTVWSGPTDGTLSGSAPDLTYTPDADFNGSDSFTFTVSDGEFDSDEATVSITVDPVNDAPVANDQSVSTDEDTPLLITLTASDVDGDALSFSVLSGPANGSLSGSGASRTYTPDADFNGSDSFTFKVNDSTVDSDEATVSIMVNPVNDPPVANDDSAATDEDTAVTIAVVANDTDVDGDSLIVSSVTQPAHGSADIILDTAVRYTPDADICGLDTFSYVVSDGHGGTDSATVSVDVTCVNDAPVAYDQSLTTAEGTPVATTLTASDIESDPLTFSVVDGPADGSLSGTAPDLTYTPDAGFSGVDSFSFQANDGDLDSNVATVEITVSPAGPSVVFEDDFETDKGWVEDPYGTDTATTGMWERANPEETSYNGVKQLGTTTSGSYDLVTGPLAGSSVGSYDIDGGATSIRSPEIALPSGGDLVLSFNYYLAHLNNASSDDYLRVQVVGSTTTTVFEELGAAEDDDAVWASFEGSLNAFAGQTVTLLIEAADAGGGSLVEAAVDDVLIVALGPNEPPTADPQSVTTDEDAAVSITLSGSDPDGDPLTYAVATGPGHGTLGGSAPNLTYTPDGDYNGPDSFTFVVNDGRDDSEPATVSITVEAVNDAPVAEDQTAITTEGTAVDITLSASDVEGDDLTYQIVDGPAHGSLSGTAPELSYTPSSGYTGPDSFTFKANDGSADSNVATVDITVNPPGPVTVFFDDFESDQGWVEDPYGTDTATTGIWERANPEDTSYSGAKQLGTTASGSYDLVTGPRAGWSVGSYDIDNGVTSIRSPGITLPSGGDLVLSFSYYLAHLNNASSDDFLRVTVEGSTSQVVFEELGAADDDDAAWETFSGSLDDFAGQTVTLLIEAADAGGASLVEAAIDDVLIVAQ